jgi:mannitol/fructose-specific phosphotransferase system IIA component (Ntr-type)
MSIGVYLDPREVNLRLQSNTKDDALRELVNMIPELKDRAAEQLSLWQALADREKLHSTGVGEGLAFPHARNAMGNLLKKPVIVIGRHEQGVDWGSADSKPAQLIFMLAAPSLTEHLHLLSQMSRILRNAKVREDLLLHCATPEQAIEILKAAEANIH